MYPVDVNAKLSEEDMAYSFTLINDIGALDIIKGSLGAQVKMI